MNSNYLCITRPWRFGKTVMANMIASFFSCGCEADRQIKEKKYALRFKEKLGEASIYTGRILAVGISYDKQQKKHFCKVEILEE